MTADIDLRGALAYRNRFRAADGVDAKDCEARDKAMDMRCSRQVVMVLVGVVSVMAGCSGRTSQPIRLAPNDRPFVGDIPVPVGFRFAEKASEDLNTGNRRMYLRHVYVGPAASYDVRNFYNEHMPRNRWRKITDGHVKGEYGMRFEKGHEDCVVSIRDRGLLRSECEIQVIITQKQRDAEPPVRRRGRPLAGQQRP